MYISMPAEIHVENKIFRDQFYSNFSIWILPTVASVTLGQHLRFFLYIKVFRSKRSVWVDLSSNLRATHLKQEESIEKIAKSRQIPFLRNTEMSLKEICTEEDSSPPKYLMCSCQVCIYFDQILMNSSFDAKSDCMLSVRNYCLKKT